MCKCMHVFIAEHVWLNGKLASSCSFLCSALGSSTTMPSSPPTTSSPPFVGERILFSNVARLGFAAGHDSPALKIEETSAACGASGISLV